jgi:hypothetical protein
VSEALGLAVSEAAGLEAEEVESLDWDEPHADVIIAVKAINEAITTILLGFFTFRFTLSPMNVCLT